MIRTYFQKIINKHEQIHAGSSRPLKNSFLRMKQIYRYVFICLVLISVLILSSCDDNNNISKAEVAIYPGSVELVLSDDMQIYVYTDESESDVYPMIKGESISLDYEMTPDEVTISDVLWTSSDEDVASVDENGTVTAMGAGTAIITVSPSVFYSGSGIYGTLKIVVSESLVKAETISLSSSADYCYAGETLTITTAISPTNATYKTVKFTSSDESIATVDVYGVVTGHTIESSSEKVTITATALDENSSVSATIDIYVKMIIQPQSVTLDQTYNKNNYLWAIGDKNYTISYTTEPEDCTKSLIEWTSSDENIATVSNGVVKFNQTGSFGDVTITATCPETGNSSQLTVNLAEGLVRELFHDSNNITWDLTAAHKSNGGSSVWSYGKMDVTTYTANATTQRGDFSKVDANIWLHAGNYPIFAFRMTDVLDDYADEGVTQRNINIDSNTSDGTYKGSLGGGNNKWTIRYKCSDGSYVFVYDLSALSFATGGLLPTTSSVSFSTLQWKYADIKTIAHQVNYSVYWVQTFKSLSDVQAYIASENLSIVE